jgi:hypothetical protein
VRREDFAVRGKKASAKGWFGVEGVAAREVFFLRQQIERWRRLKFARKTTKTQGTSND